MAAAINAQHFGVPLRATPGLSHRQVVRDIPAAVAIGLQAAVAAGEQAWGNTSPNPPVGAAIVTPGGQLIATGHTQEVGGNHAEIEALAQAGARAAGNIMVVTLEPCNHFGRTGPCSQAIAKAGIAQVWYCNQDLGKQAGGGARWLETQGIPTYFLDLEVAALEPWLYAAAHQLPFVIAKTAHTLDGRIAASDGSSQWITDTAARQHAHSIRAQVDVILVGTGTVFTDNPRLTARTASGQDYAHQPEPIIIGSRPIGPEYHLANARQFLTPADALDTLYLEGKTTVLVEGGSQLVTSMLQAAMVQQLHAYIAPAILGSGTQAYRGFAAPSIDEITRLQPVATLDLYPDICRILQVDAGQ